MAFSLEKYPGGCFGYERSLPGIVLKENIEKKEDEFGVGRGITAVKFQCQK